MTKWVVAFVAVAIISFILGDLFGNSPTALFGGQDNSIGEIAGDRISADEFNRAVQEMEINFANMMGRQATERDLIGLREQAWTLLIARHAIVPQYEKVGSEVTNAEMFDMLQGKNVDENLKMGYLDSTGAFDRNKLLKDLQDLEKQPAGSPGRLQWERYRNQMRSGRERVKYENLLLKTNYVTQAEAERQYHVDNDVAEIKYLYVPYYAVKDSAAPITDADLKKYYDENKAKYKADETRSFSYVTFPLVASSQDTISLRTDMEKLAADFHNAENDSTFAALNTEGYYPFERHTANTLPTYLNKETITKGLVLGPFIDNGAYKVVKVSDIGTDTAYQLRASHILIKWTAETPEAKKIAKDKANKVLADIKGGANFAQKAMEVSEDNTNKMRGGDLGWFSSSGGSAAFKKAILNAPKTGLIPNVVESGDGYHIIDVTAPKSNMKYSIATIEKEIVASQETQDEQYRRADMFATDLDGVEDFKSRAKEQGLSIYESGEVTANERYIGNLGDAREMVTWVYRDTKVGKVSNIFDLDRDYAVAVMTGKSDGGYRPLDDKLKAEITVIVRKEKQGKAIIEKLSGDASLEDLAKAYPRDAVVSTAADVKMTLSNLANIGYDPVAIGKAFSVENGKRTKPFAGETGVVVIEVQNKTVAPSMGDYSLFKDQLLRNANNRSGLEIADAIKATADIEDRRYKLY
jgi:peptidyl-prolyl cis-trans isomerase D